MTTITWTACREALPDEDESVLIACDDGAVEVGFLDEGEWRLLDAMPIPDCIEVTHWAHLPDHPDDLGDE